MRGIEIEFVPGKKNPILLNFMICKSERKSWQPYHNWYELKFLLLYVLYKLLHGNYIVQLCYAIIASFNRIMIEKNAINYIKGWVLNSI